MKRVGIFCLLMLVVFLISGCKTLWWEKETTAPVTEQAVEPESEPQPVLSSEESFYLDSWMNAAQLAEEVKDYSTAITYYGKVVEYYADTEQGKKAQAKLEKL